jgi:hypothetical protein
MWHLVQMLRLDPTSRMYASIAGWNHPVTREAMVLMDLYDLQHASKSKRRPKPYPRPWPLASKKLGGKKTVRRSVTDVLAILRPKK